MRRYLVTDEGTKKQYVVKRKPPGKLLIETAHQVGLYTGDGNKARHGANSNSPTSVPFIRSNASTVFSTLLESTTRTCRFQRSLDCESTERGNWEG